MWSAYRSAIARQPMLVNVTTSAATMLFGDSVAQAIELRRRDSSSSSSSSSSSVDAAWSPQRSLIAVGWNALIFTPTFLVWFRYLDRVFPGAALLPSVQKVLVNQIVLSVPINGAYLAYTSLVERALSPHVKDPGVGAEGGLAAKVGALLLLFIS